MTYQPPNTGHQQQPPSGYPLPSAGGPDPLPHPAGPPWPAAPAPPPRRRRRAMLIAIVVAVLLGAVVLTVVLSTGGGSTSRFTGAPSDSVAAAPTAGSGVQNPGGTTPNSSRPLPPPTPTGRPYNTDDAHVGDCADLARRPTGISIYHANCDDPAATLVLESILPENEKCLGKGFFGLRNLSKKGMCFTYNLQIGDCVDMQIPRRAACADPAAPTGGKPVVTVVEIRLGQQDGTGCADPAFILQVGKGNERGVACLADSKQNTPPKPSR